MTWKSLNITVFSLLALAGFCLGCTSYNRNAEGVKYYGQARYPEALSAFQVALQAEPNNQDAYYNIGATYHQMGKLSLQTGQGPLAQQQYELAEQNYRLCLARDPNHTAAYRGLAVLNMERMNPEAAFNVLLDWARLQPTSADAKIELARLYQEYAQICLQQGRAEDAATCQNTAVQYLQMAQANDPNNFRVWRAMGYLREQSGDVVNAISDYQRSLELNASQKDLQDRLTLLRQGSGLLPSNPSFSGGTGSTSGGATVYNPQNTPVIGSSLRTSPF